MKAAEANLLKFIKKSTQFIIPIYQRHYTWTEQQCQQLWDDILKAGRNEQTEAHFIGSIVYIEKALSSVTQQESLLLIDGQQRLTTITLFILALAHHFEKNNLSEILDSFSVRKLENYYLFNPEEEGERRYKLILSETDKKTLLALFDKFELPQSYSIRIKENYDFFKKCIENNSSELEQICKGLAKLEAVEIALDRQHDNPQLIFESMNSTGLALSQADLIRNYILMRLPQEKQSQLYTNYWRPMEVNFGQAAYTTNFDSFIRHYLTLKTNEIPKQNQIYTSFKEYALAIKLETKELVEDIYQYSVFYCAMALGREKDKELKDAFKDLRDLKVDVAYPLLLELYSDYHQNSLNKQDFLAIIKLIESYVFRRAVCGLPTNSLNKTFATFRKFIHKENYRESVEAAFLNLLSYNRIPRDKEFLQSLQSRDLYNFPRKTYFLFKIENYGRKEKVSPEGLTIEHILPQNENLSKAWQNDLGEQWQDTQQKWLHTLGNLTLTAYNSSYSDRSFKEKCALIDDKGEAVGLTVSPLKLNQGLNQYDKWDASSIQDRSDHLAKKAKHIWGIPTLKKEVLQTYTLKNKRDQTGKYTIADHPPLQGSMRSVFEALRAEILALDHCVTEEFLKQYVAYKAETNFVDIVAQSKRLCLILNLKFNEINDPKEKCRDLSGLGRWGNGDIEISLSSENEIPYVMTLIKQSFEKQIEL